MNALRHPAALAAFVALIATLATPHPAATGPDAPPAPAPSQVPKRAAAAVLVKDFLRLENSGREVRDVEFLRYFPAADAEQFPLARWVSAATDAGESIPISIAAVHPDPAGNLVHTFRLDRAPEKTGVVVTITSIVLRREPRPPKGAFPIPAPDAYPPEVRPYLASTKAVVHDHPEIRERAKAMLAQAEGDALKLARIIARHMNTRKYESDGQGDCVNNPTSVVVLEHGGSCCSSAVGAAAIFRACGVPAQLTYTPAGYVHGVVQFYLDGYGWLRMDATCASARVPLVHDDASRGLVRLFNMPVEMEALHYAYAWPYYHNTMAAPYAFWSGGRRVPGIRLADRSESTGAPNPFVSDPFPHLEPGSWNTVLKMHWWRIPDDTWRRWSDLAREAILTDTLGAFDAVVDAMADEGADLRIGELIESAQRYGTLDPAPQATTESRR